MISPKGILIMTKDRNNKKGLITALLVLLSTLVIIGLAGASTGPYHGNAQSHIFHSPSCRYYTCKACTVTFGTREAAVVAGYRPCRRCTP